MTDKEAMKLALEALEQTLETFDNENSKPGGAIADTIWHSEHETLFDYLTSTIAALKERLTQPEPIQSLQCANCQVTIETLNDKVMHLMAQRKPLTDEQVISKALHLSGLGTSPDVLQFARAIEAAHGIKENA